MASSFAYKLYQARFREVRDTVPQGRPANLQNQGYGLTI